MWNIYGRFTWMPPNQLMGLHLISILQNKMAALKPILMSRERRPGPGPTPTEMNNGQGHSLFLSLTLILKPKPTQGNPPSEPTDWAVDCFSL